MTSPNNTVFLSDIKEKTLAQWLPNEASNIGLSLNFDEQQKSFELFTRADNVNNEAQTQSSQSVELVVFSDLQLEYFSALLSQCQIKHLILHAINERNGATSYRFLVKINDLKAMRAQLVSYIADKPMEAALICNAPKLAEPGLLVMDMDSTTIKIECIDEIAALAGVGEEVAAVTELAMQGQLDFSQSLHQRVGKLNGSSEDILARVAKNIPLMEGLETLVVALKKHQWRVAIASGGFTYFADHLKNMLELDAAFANVLEIKNKTLTGKVLGQVIDAQAKADCLIELQQQYSIAPSQTVAMGDGANDLVMMAAAHLGIAYHAKPIVLAQADSCITGSGLDCMLHWLA